MITVFALQEGVLSPLLDPDLAALPADILRVNLLGVMRRRFRQNPGAYLADLEQKPVSKLCHRKKKQLQSRPLRVPSGQDVNRDDAMALVAHP